MTVKFGAWFTNVWLFYLLVTFSVCKQTWPFSFQHSSTTTISSNCNSGGCWTNSRDSEEEEYQDIPHHQQNHTERSNQHIIIEYNPCYQQYDYNESVMHIG